MNAYSAGGVSRQTKTVKSETINNKRWQAEVRGNKPTCILWLEERNWYGLNVNVLTGCSDWIPGLWMLLLFVRLWEVWCGWSRVTRSELLKVIAQTYCLCSLCFPVWLCMVSSTIYSCFSGRSHSHHPACFAMIDWTLWNCEPMQILPPFSYFCHMFAHREKKRD